MTAALAIAAYGLHESVRRRVFWIVLVITLALGGLYAFVVHKAFEDASGFAGNRTLIDAHVLTGATLLGLAMFGTLFLGCVLAVFLTLGAVRGDAERGLLQPLVVRPVGRSAFLLVRFATAAAVCGGYVVAVYAGAVLVDGLIGGWWPDRLVLPAVELAAAIAVIVALGLLGSVFLSSTATGIAIFMLFGGGLVGGLLGQVGEALPSATLTSISHAIGWALPFEALYQSALDAITADTHGVTGAIVQLGPFGLAHRFGPALGPWAAGYLAAVAAVALAAFNRRDL